MEYFCEFDFYKTEYMAGKTGVIPEEEFPIYAREATFRLRADINMDLLTEYDTLPEDLQMAACKIAELIYGLNSSNGAEGEGSSASVPVGVSSEKVGEYSVTYSGNSMQDVQAETERQIRNVIKRWLGPTGLLYKGVYLHVRK